MYKAHCIRFLTGTANRFIILFFSFYLFCVENMSLEIHVAIRTGERVERRRFNTLTERNVRRTPTRTKLVCASLICVCVCVWNMYCMKHERRRRTRRRRKKQKKSRIELNTQQDRYYEHVCVTANVRTVLN